MRSLFALLVLCLVAPFALGLGTQEEPKYKEVVYADFAKLVEAKRVTIVDANPLDVYDAGHVPAARHFATIEKDLANQLPRDKGAAIVVYCGGPTCPAWKGAADAIAKLGYTNVKHYKGGISGWKAEGGRIETSPPTAGGGPTKDPQARAVPEISFSELKTAVESGKLVVIDVNSAESYAAGHVPGALHYSAVEKDFATKLPKEKDALIVAYCGGPSCNAYKRAADAATKLGYTNVKHYKGGISGWKAEGGRIEVVKP